MRYYLYVLRSTRADRLYIGSSAEPDERLKSHNFGKVCSAKAWRPWERVLLEEYQDRATAEKRERYLKVRMGPQRAGSTFGEVAERLNAAVLKTAVGLPPTVGSNPTLSGGMRTSVRLPGAKAQPPGEAKKREVERL